MINYLEIAVDREKEQNRPGETIAQKIVIKKSGSIVCTSYRTISEREKGKLVAKQYVTLTERKKMEKKVAVNLLSRAKEVLSKYVDSRLKATPESQDKDFIYFGCDNELVFGRLCDYVSNLQEVKEVYDLIADQTQIDNLLFINN